MNPYALSVKIIIVLSVIYVGRISLSAFSIETSRVRSINLSQSTRQWFLARRLINLAWSMKSLPKYGYLNTKYHVDKKARTLVQEILKLKSYMKF